MSKLSISFSQILVRTKELSTKFSVFSKRKMNMNFSRAIVRSFTTSSVRRAAVSKGEIEKGYFEIRKVQEHFQKKDGKPVFLKGSMMDQVLYRLTVVLSLVGLGGIGKLFYELSVPKN